MATTTPRFPRLRRGLEEVTRGGELTSLSVDKQRCGRSRRLEGEGAAPAPTASSSPPHQQLIWKAANSVAWGPRFLGPDGNATVTTVDTSFSNSTNSPTSSSSGGNESSTLFIAIIVSLIVAFYLLCTYQCLRIWLCRKCFGREVDVWGRALPPSSLHRHGAAGDVDGEGGSGPDSTVLVHEGRVFNLSGDQRRQVLEVIFSEASKPATDMDVAKLKKKRRKRHGGVLGDSFDDDGDDDDLEAAGGRRRGDSDDDDDEGGRLSGVPLDVQIPGVATAQTEDTSTDDGTASPTSSPSSSEGADKVVARSPPGPRRDHPDGHGDDDSITSHGDIAAESAGACGGDDEYDSTGTSSLSVSDPDPTKEGPSAGGAADSTSRGSDSPSSTPESNKEGRDDVVLLTPIRLDSAFDADDESGAAECEGATPRASSHKTSFVENDPVPCPASSDSLSLLGATADSRSTRSSAIGDESAMLRTMVPMASHHALRPAPKAKNFVIPEDEIVEESKREIVPGGSGDSDDANNNRDLSLHIPIPLMKRESFASATSEYTYDDGSTITGDNVCPICLSGFKIGDLLVTAKYCSHVFHKDCILEWLGKSDNCPVCRVDMVTASEMNKAATTLVGKTRMVRAVASLQANSSHARAPTSTSPQRPGNAVSPFEGTVRRRAYSATYS